MTVSGAIEVELRQSRETGSEESAASLASTQGDNAAIVSIVAIVMTHVPICQKLCVTMLREEASPL